MKIFVCFDGTWNDQENPDDETGESCPTNVRRFFLALRKGPVHRTSAYAEVSDERDGQIAFYARGWEPASWTGSEAEEPVGACATGRARLTAS